MGMSGQEKQKLGQLIDLCDKRIDELSEHRQSNYAYINEYQRIRTQLELKLLRDEVNSN